MEKVEWKFKDLFKADAQKVYEEIGEDKVTPEQVLEKAKDENTELHKCFDWDDTSAANKYRLYQARTLIQSFVLVREDEEKPKIRAYQITTETAVYQPTRLFLQQPDEYKALLERAKGELKAFRQKYKQLQELSEIFEEIDAL